MRRREKVVSLSEAVADIPDGAHIAIAGTALHSHPMSLIRELIRQEKRNLVIMGEIQGLEADMLCGAGVVSQIESAGVGLERFGLARNFRRAVEQGAVRMKDYSVSMALDRIRATAEGLPFWPVSHLEGTDLPRYLDDLVPMTCPFSGREFHAMPPARVDYALIHAPYADVYGNVMFPSRYLMPNSQDLIMSRAATKTIVTVEHVVDPHVITQHPFMVKIPAFRVAAVSASAWGAHPSSMMDFYDFDEGHLSTYVESSKSDDDFLEYLARYVLGPGDERGYLEAVGLASLLDCRRVVSW